MRQKNNNSTDKPAWLKKSELLFTRTGKLIISNVENPDLSLIKTRPSLKELNISRCKIDSLEGLAFQPNINTFNAEGSSLSSFKNFHSISRATSFILKNTPLSDNPAYVIGLIIMIGDTKFTLNGKQVNPSWYRKAYAYPSYTRDLLNNGWEIQYPCPSSQDFVAICNEFDVTYIPDEDDDNYLPTGDFHNEEEEHLSYLDLIDMLMERHNQMILEASRKFELLDMTDEKFSFQIRDLLETQKHYVFQDDGDIDLQIVTAVRALCLHKGNTKEPSGNK